MVRYTKWDEELGSYLLTDLGKRVIKNKIDAINYLGLAEEKIDQLVDDRERQRYIEQNHLIDEVVKI